jgi:hypothetical protein
VESEGDGLCLVVEVDEALLVLVDRVLDRIVQLRARAAWHVVVFDFVDPLGEVGVVEVEVVPKGDVRAVLDDHLVEDELFDVESVGHRLFLVLRAVVLRPPVWEEIQYNRLSARPV